MPFPKASASSKIDALINIPKKAPKVSAPNGNLQELFDSAPVKPERPTKQPKIKNPKAARVGSPKQLSAPKRGNYASLLPDNAPTKPKKAPPAFLGARHAPVGIVGM